MAPTEHPSDVPPLVDNVGEGRFELTADGHTAFLVYKRTAETLELIHTEVPEELRGRHFGDALVEFALERAHAEHHGSWRYARSSVHI